MDRNKWEAMLDRPQTTSRKNPWVRLACTFPSPVRDAETVDDSEIYDVAIAIGIGVTPAGTGPSPRSFANVKTAFEFWRAGKARQILLCGGNGIVKGAGNGMTEAEAMYVALKSRVPDGRVHLDKASTTTAENAQEALRFMHEHNWRSAIITAEAIHANRVYATFRKQWAGTHLRFTVVRTYGAYGNSAGWPTTPFPFLLYNTAAGVVSKLKGWS
jgi:uncharacterized SAM-binding protein YcdF (DUF218 family)